MSGHETDSLLPGHKTSPNAASPATPIARRALALKIVVALCGAAAVAAVALTRASRGGGLRASPEEQCVSVQEHTWGTDGLAKLEAIKAKVDPQGLFQCQKCVGFKGPVRDQ